MSPAATKAPVKSIDRDSGLTFQHLDSNPGGVIGSQTVGRRLHDLSEGSRTQNRTYRETRDTFRINVARKLIRFKKKKINICIVNKEVLDPVSACLWETPTCSCTAAGLGQQRCSGFPRCSRLSSNESHIWVSMRKHIGKKP